ncbi:MAG: c-type cytochrome [Vulcanimicrobiaceae bacterium]
MLPRPVHACVALMAIALFAGCAHHARERSLAVAPEQRAATQADSSSSRGGRIFAMQCAMCHGSAGAGGPVGPSLRDERARKTPEAVIGAIEHPTPPMPKLFPGTLSAQDVADLGAYIESL